MLDRTEQRIVGVLIEKEATVPDTYPMTEHALVAGCNQKNNRDPLMELQSFQVAGALMALQEKGWVARIDGSGRVTKYRHKVEERFGLGPQGNAVLCELLLRGPQSPGALKPRVQRLGFTAEPAAIEAVLQQLASRPQPLVEQLSLAARERDRKWRHLLGDGSESVASPVAMATGEDVGAAAPAALVPPVPKPAPDLANRVAALERDVAALQRQLTNLLQRPAAGD